MVVATKAARKRSTPSRHVNTVANDLQQIQIRDAQVKIAELLRSNPQQVLPCLHALETKFFEKREVGAKALEWPSTYMRCDQIPKYWLAALLTELQPSLTEALLRSIDHVDKDAIRQLTEFATGMKPLQKLPRCCLDKAVLKLTLTQLYMKHGKRLGNGWTDQAINLEGKVDWHQHGVYSFAMDPENRQGLDSSGFGFIRFFIRLNFIRLVSSGFSFD